MTGLGELNSVQAPIADALVDAGWTFVPGEALDRTFEQPFVEAEVVAALIRLNPEIAADPSRVDEILPLLRMLPLASWNDGLVATNQRFASWLNGSESHEYIGTNGPAGVKLIDFDDFSNNRFVVSTEVTFGPPSGRARFDVVLWVNGFPLVVGELKTPSSQLISWVKAASEIVDVYQPRHPDFFVPNVVCFASEGKEFMYAAVGNPVQSWEQWGKTTESPKLADVLTSVRSMLTPAVVLDLLRNFTLYEAPKTNDDDGRLHKIIARYTQYEAVNLICERAVDPERKGGLIYHTQGSGKTLAMVFAAGKMLRDPRLNLPTVVLIADRVSLVRQTWDQFRTTNMPRLVVPSTANEFKQLLRSDRRGIIFSTVHKFAGAQGELNARDNIIVLVDEAHRTQEGGLGLAMRAALPNATFVGFSGTPIAGLDRNTFRTFGDVSDPGYALHSYDSDQSIADGMTVPVHVAPRLVTFNLDRESLDTAFEALRDEEDLDEEQAEVLTRRVSKKSTFFSNPERIRAVCADIIEHFYATVDPLGMKAQIVVIDREACADYFDQLTAQLAAMDIGDEVAVVISVTSSKDEDPRLVRFRLSESEEEALLKRFRTFSDPLKFLIVTSKLGTGFDAPIEGVLYLDKPLKEHTLFQTITRTNRRWQNPATKQDKRYGLVVDYVGLGGGFARAMAPANPDQKQRDIDIDGLVDMFESEIGVAMVRFAGIDHERVTSATLLNSQERFSGEKDLAAFFAQFKLLEGVWESTWPHDRLLPWKSAYRFLSQVYATLAPSSGNADLSWQRLGAKTLDLVHSYMSDIRIETRATVIVADANTIQRLIDDGFGRELIDVKHQSAADIVDSIAARLKKRLEGANGDHAIFVSLAERLERLREQTLTAAEQSFEWLRDAFELARDVTTAERAEDEGGVDGLSMLPDPRLGALTQIFDEFAPPDTPAMVGRVVADIDAIVKEVRFDGWAATQKGDRAVRRAVRSVLRKYQLHTHPELFDRAYEYIAVHY
ncbi:MAG TPA: HsdR family type I site-specific deoxyribonuclease [Ilumatobacteraceae bacterium]|nr:HsdR family type I site-specific deoxyribonuclease [Ilumatobacteraceae bacterium]